MDIERVDADNAHEVDMILAQISRRYAAPIRRALQDGDRVSIVIASTERALPGDVLVAIEPEQDREYYR